MDATRAADQTVAAWLYASLVTDAMTTTPPVALAATDGSLRHALVGRLTRQATLIHELSLPSDRLRADVAQILPRHLVGFEIKSSADRLDRLSRQARAYEEVFARCYLVVAPRHLTAATSMVPSWWGLITPTKDGAHLRTARKAQAHDNARPEVLVRLLWRQEAVSACLQLGLPAPAGVPRAELWRSLVHALDLSGLQAVVARALIDRDPRQARIPTRWSTGLRDELVENVL
ncbi:hypothetical protein acdb102_15930 [Acidothermaceae bacterium B102]|nr:hypothetical protein acdb102_15930 [Acidothermaceae bacterium B102]